MYSTAVHPDHRSFRSTALPTPEHYPESHFSKDCVRPGFASRCASRLASSRGLEQQERPRQERFPSHKISSRGGLRTPPFDEMGTSYQVPNLASYENQHVHLPAYAPTVAANRASARDLSYDPVRYPTSREQCQQYQRQQQQQPVPQGRSNALPCTASQAPVSRPSTRPGTPLSGTLSGGASHRTISESSTAARDAAMILHSLQMPPCIGAKGGDLVDLTAQITCMIWFEPISTLEAAEKIRSLAANARVRPLTEAASRGMSTFKEWVRDVLSTTQVTQNVILLALLYIYRLKVTNPTVRGQAGSEYRLLTVALMLGNKFLDDNTYTNKTWADVSKIDVKEIHVMEVEFLQNMRYNLLASRADWEDWLVKLAGLKEYYDRAQRPPVSPVSIPASGYRSAFVSPLSSPTGMLQPTPSSHQTAHALPAYSPTSAILPSNGSAAWQPAHATEIASSPLAPRPVLHSQSQNSRKRSLEEDQTEQPAKRVNRQPLRQPVPQQPQQQQPQLPVPDLSYQAPTPDRYNQTQATLRSDLVRLSVPNLTMNANLSAMSSGMTQATGNQYASQQATGRSLPPLGLGVRAMSTVFPPTTTSFAPQLVLGSTGPAMTPVSAPSLTPISSYPPSNYGTPTKRMSPQNSLASAAAAAAAYAPSPSAGPYPHLNLTPIKNSGTGSGFHTPISQSPSVYLQQRASPYKPVRHFNTLLYPPPSAFLSEYHSGNGVPATQMHYQPLGRREIRTGILPEFSMARPTMYGTGQQSTFTPAPIQGMHQMPQHQMPQQQMPQQQMPQQQMPQQQTHYTQG